jgi:ribosome maturation factor RimP
MEYIDHSEELQKMIASLLEDEGVDLIEFKFSKTQGRALLRLLVDKGPDGITVGECSRLNKKIGNLLDERDIIGDSYLLEVSSPGVDRPLAVKKDFLRCRGKKVKFLFSEPVEDRFELDAEIKDAGEDSVTVEAGGRLISVPLAKINKAQQII